MAQSRSPSLVSVTDRPSNLAIDPSDLACLTQLERKLLWLSAWTIHNANHIRPSVDGLKVGGHQASSASLVSVMTALYFRILKPQDRVAVKPHASPVFHAIQYLLGEQTQTNLENFRALGGAQSYPSRTKDADDVDFSTGSVGLGVAMTSFASLVQDYVRMKGLVDTEQEPGRMIALMGDAELDEGNIFEALMEGWKHDLRNTWWVVDYNRQSLDSVISDHIFTRVDDVFRTTGWNVVTLKYGKKLQAAFERPGGDALRQWIDDCPNSLYSALTFKGGASWREQLQADLKGVPGIKALLQDHDDDGLADLMTNLAGHDMESLVEAFEAVDSDLPHCFIAYTVKGHGLPFAGHKDNHAGLMNPDQMDEFKRMMQIEDGREWDRFAGLDLPADELEAFLDKVPFAQSGPRRYKAPAIPVPNSLDYKTSPVMSTQDAFGRILNELAGGASELADRIVTTSPDVTVSTNLGPWVNRRGIFARRQVDDIFKEQKVVSAQRWSMSRKGQHIELGIAENNLFIMLAALGLSESVFGARLLPVGTLYDPFVKRGLDALNYACYQDARFMLVGTPSGITLAPEGGAHQSMYEPLIGMGQDGIASFEPAFVDELATIMRWGFEYMQRDGSGRSETDWLRDVNGGSVYLRLTTRAIEQPERPVTDAFEAGVINGGYWLKQPEPGAELALVYCGVIASEALAAYEAVAEDIPGAGLLAVTSPDRLNAGWSAAMRARESGRVDAVSEIERLLRPLAPDAGLVTVIDGHPATLAWLGSVYGHRVQAMGVEHFGQSGNIPDLYRLHRIDADAILDACASVCLAARA